jgi:prepilin-type N-terminal cleavage/methylation domain-containing protein
MKVKGFTLIELIVVVITIGVLAAIASPLFFKAIENSRQAEAVNILARMYKGYKTAIIDEVLITCDNSVNFFNHTCTQPDEKHWFNPDESDSYPSYNGGHSAMSWKALGFEQNPNYPYDNKLYFSYDFLKPNQMGWTNEEKQSPGPSSTGRGGGGTAPRPGGAAYNNVNMFVAWRKTGGYDNGYELYNINSTKYIFIIVENGTIVKSSDYQ